MQSLAAVRSSAAACSAPRSLALLRQQQRRWSAVLVRTAEVAAPVIAEPAPAISVTEKAMGQLRRLRAELPADKPLWLRVGVKQGGCSGMSYKMDFEEMSNVSAEDDHVMTFDDIKVVIDPKSLLFLFGMNLDFSDALIGGGFQFQNPNAVDSCGCGKSFGV